MSKVINWTNFLSTKKQLEIKSGDLKLDETYIGIDFGTSTTVVSIATVDQDGLLKVSHLPLKQKLFTDATATDYRVNSVVAYHQKKLLIGKGAKDISTKLKRNINFWQSFKMELGTDKGCSYPNSEYPHFKNHQDVAIFFFKGLKNSIDKYISDENLPTKIKFAVTIPASFESNQRIDLIECLNKANIVIEESGLIDEPNAAFLSYFLDSDSEKTGLKISDNYNPVVLVFDFGAGTCDISILEIGETHKGFHTKNISISQYAEIGGDNIDEMIARSYLIPQLFAQSKRNQNELRKKEIDFEILPHLISFAEKLKIEASERIAVYPDIIGLPKSELMSHPPYTIANKKRFNTRIGELIIDSPSLKLNEYIDVCSQFCFDADFKDLNLQINPVFSALEKSKLKPDDIDYLLFIGGSSNNVVIRNQVQSVFKNATVLLPNNLQGHVSKGAAIHSLLLHKFETQIISPISNQRIFTFIGVNGEEQELSVIESGMPVPFPEICIDKFRPQRNGQKIVEIPFFVGNRNSELAKIVLKSPTEFGFKLNDKIKLSIKIDVNKVMDISASINDKVVTLNIKNPFSAEGKTLKEKEIQNALKEYNISINEFGGKAPKKNYEALIEAYEKNGDLINAAELLEEAVEMYNLRNKYNQLNLLYSQIGYSKKALHYAEMAVEISPNNSTLLFNLAHQFRYSDPDKAIGYLQKSYTLDPKRPTTLYLLGNLLSNSEGKKYIQDAFNIWNERLKKHQMDSWDYSWFASCADYLGENDLARLIRNSENVKSDSKFYDKDNLMQIDINNEK